MDSPHCGRIRLPHRLGQRCPQFRGGGEDRLIAIEDIGPGETGWTLAADRILKPANAARAVEILLNAIAQARDEGEELPDWLDEAEDSAIDALRSAEIA